MKNFIDVLSFLAIPVLCIIGGMTFGGAALLIYQNAPQSYFAFYCILACIIITDIFISNLIKYFTK